MIRLASDIESQCLMYQAGVKVIPPFRAVTKIPCGDACTVVYSVWRKPISGLLLYPPGGFMGEFQYLGRALPGPGAGAPGMCP